MGWDGWRERETKSYKRFCSPQGGIILSSQSSVQGLKQRVTGFFKKLQNITKNAVI